MPPYEITVDEQQHILIATLRGYWEIATTEQYLADLLAAGTRVSPGGKPSWWLINTSDYPVQSRETSDLMREKLPSIFPSGAIVAILVAATLQALQVKRVAPNLNHRTFSAIGEARSWLADCGMPA